ncbi:MAG: TolC family protein [Verrucomicrobia bacterium]|nr:TolC family protein [Verrucomicrobiota bacterium]
MILTVVLSVCAGARAQEETKPLTADDCARLALERNRLVRAAREQTEAARQSLRETGAQRLPRLTTSAFYQKYDEPSTAGTTGGFGAGGSGAFGVEEISTADVSLVQPLAGQIGLRHAVGIARLEATIAALEQQAAENAAAFGARKAYYSVLKTEKTVESVQKTIEEFERTLEVVRNYREAGRVLQRDVNKADIAVERAKLALIEAQNALQSARSGLRDVLGLDLDAETAREGRLVLTPAEEIEPLALTLTGCLATAEVQRPELRASALRLAAARRGVALAKSAYVPSIGASLSYQWEDTDLTEMTESAAVGLNWSWDVWDWGKRRAAVRGAEASARTAAFAYDNERNQVAIEIERLWLAVALAGEKIGVARKDWDYAVENVRVSEQQYEAGTLLVTDLLDDQTQLNDARIGYYVAVYDYAIALAELRRAIGEQ